MLNLRSKIDLHKKKDRYQFFVEEQQEQCSKNIH